MQRWMQDALIFPGRTDTAATSELVVEPKLGSAARRLAIYQRSYYERLLSCMREQFPALCHALGQELFDDFALEYLRDTPENKAFIAKVKPVFEKYKNIGVRIEDVMVITKTGVDWMSKDLPRSRADVEAFMAKASKEMAKYALTNKRIDPALAVHGNKKSVTNFDYQAGIFDSVRVTQGETMRTGWKDGGRTHDLHAH